MLSHYFVMNVHGLPQSRLFSQKIDTRTVFTQRLSIDQKVAIIMLGRDLIYVLGKILLLSCSISNFAQAGI